MASRSKRKRDSYEQGNTISSTAMPQANTAGLNGKKTNYYDDRYPPIFPTPELQDLYNTWRQQQEINAHVKEQAQVAVGSSDGGSQHLRPHSAVGMSRSPSYASTSHSVTAGMNNMVVSDNKPAKKRQGRQGPLEASNKAGAALVRKLNACRNCHRRKVKCDHYNFRLLEDAYQASKRIVPPTAQRARSGNPENVLAQQQDLMGVGVGPILNIPPSQYSTFDELGEQDDLLLNAQASPMSPNSTAPLYFLSGSSHSRNIVTPGYNNVTNNYTNYNYYPNYNSVTSMPTTAADSSYAYPSSFSPMVPSGAPVAASGTQTIATDPVTDPVTDHVGDRHIAIGRRVASSIGQQFHGYQGGGYPFSLYGGSTTQGDGQWEWECLYGDDGTASSVSYPHSNYSGSNEAPQPCKKRYGEREHLEAHFQQDHVPYENGQIYLFCTRHEQHYDYEILHGQCPSCLEETGTYEGGHATTTAGPDGGWLSFSPTLRAAGNNANNSDQFQQQWLFGNVVSHPDNGTGQRKSGRVPSKDGGLSGAGPFAPLTRNNTVTQFDAAWNSASYGGGGGGGGGGGWGSYSAANQGGGGRRRGNSAFPGGDSFSSLSSPGDLPLGPSAREGGNNNAHRYGDARVNLVLSPPPSSFMKTMPFASLSSKMLLPHLIFPPSSKTSDFVYTKHDDTLSHPTPAALTTTKASGQIPATATRGRPRARSYCPYYAYGKELMGARKSRSMKRSASDIRSRSSVSIPASPGWPSGGTCTSTIFDSHSSTSHLATPKPLILFSVIMVFILTLTHALPSPAQFPSSSFTAAKIAEKSSVVCVVLGLVGMWLVRKHHHWSQRARDDLESRRLPPRGERKGPLLSGVGMTGDYPSPSANRKQGIYSHAHTHAHVHPQASAAAAG